MPKRWTILIADDQPGTRELLRVTLDASDYLIVDAADGDAAWTVLQTVRPDVAVLDVGMPGRDGLELTRAIRADPLLAGVQVILLTGLGELADEVAGYAAGADYYLTKPFSPLQLVQTIEACLGSSTGISPAR
jgi:DNA-binding response OmpR family regulator